MEVGAFDMTAPEETLDLVAELRSTPRPKRRQRVRRLAYPTLVQLALVLLDEPVVSPAPVAPPRSEP